MILRAESVPVWARDVSIPRFAPLESDIRVDVCVIGSGIVGLTTAHLLSRDRTVAVLEAGAAISGESSRTTAHLTHALDDRYGRIIDLRGEDVARLVAESHTRSIDHIERMVQEHGIDCDFERVDGFLFAPPGSDGESLDREMRAARRVGIDAEWADRAPLGGFDSGRVIRYPGQAQFHPLRYLVGLMDAFRRAGGSVYCDSRVVDVAGGTLARVETEAGPIVTADAVVVATNSPINERVALHTKQAAYRTYVIAAPVLRGSVPHALYWDTAQEAEHEGDQPAPYHYVRVATAGGASSDARTEWLIVGGEDHKTGQADDEPERFARLEAWARARFGDGAQMGPVEHRWSGQVLEPFDTTAFIGPDPTDQQNVYVATGDSGNGMTGGTVAGLLLADLIRGVENPWAEAYDPSRKTRRGVLQFAKENLNAAARMVRDKVRRSEVKSLDEIAPGEGAVMRDGKGKIAVYRDPEGRYSARSAVCTHLGCVVSWNHSAATWDCPCHGSRFDPMGTVVNGPAVTDLPPAEVTHAEVPQPETPRMKARAPTGTRTGDSSD